MESCLHLGNNFTAACVACARPVCSECQEVVADHAMCPACVAAASARLSSTEAQPASPGIDQPAGVTPDMSPPVVPDAPWLQTPAVPPADPGISVAPVKTAMPPGFVRRVGRGMFWGAIYGQWWTLMRIVASFIWGQGGVSAGEAVFMVIAYGFFGSVTGAVIGAANASVGTGTAMGVGGGIMACLAEMALSHDTGQLINFVFYFFTGRFVGRGITRRVQQPVQP